jgi:8-oxo-dGTP pyrophosphatase MutT (NUDIX family)
MQKRETRVQLVIVENGKYILLKHRSIRDDYIFWGLPGGGVMEGETEEEAAIREAKEETGLEVLLLPGKFESVPTSPDGIYKRFVTFLAVPVAGTAHLGFDPESEDELLFRLEDIRWHRFDDTEGIDEVTRTNVEPVQAYVASDFFVKRAGVVAYKRENGVLRCLFISSRVDPSLYILPAGHQEKGEELAETAKREAMEESGVEVSIEDKLGFSFFEKNGVYLKTDYFLASMVSEGHTAEDRRIEWFTYEEAVKINTFREARGFLKEVHYQLTNN